MRYRVIPPTPYRENDKPPEAILSLEKCSKHNEVSIYCHIDGEKHTIGWFNADGEFRMMFHLIDAARKLESVGFRLDGGEVVVRK